MDRVAILSMLWPLIMMLIGLPLGLSVYCLCRRLWPVTLAGTSPVHEASLFWGIVCIAPAPFLVALSLVAEYLGYIR